MINTVKNSFVEGAQGRPVLYDVFYQADQGPKPVVLFWHGFKGFKDWGCWARIGEAFAAAGYVFLACNFSHNGTTPAAPTEFGNLEAFGQNNFHKELIDIQAMLDHITTGPPLLPDTEIDNSAIYLIGHSRGGGTCLLQAARDARIKKIITWAAVSRLDYLWQRQPEIVPIWKTTGVHYILNGRTQQQMPLYFQLYEDTSKNYDQYDVEQACTNIKSPLLIIHGTEDPAVPVSAAHQLAKWHAKATLHIIEGANHVFGASHPYNAPTLPPHTVALVEQSIAFLQS